MSDLCRSELARDGLENAAGCQACSVIVDDHREQARSYKGASGYQSMTVGILRGAMKYIQISAMKYIAGIRVNSTV